MSRERLAQKISCYFDSELDSVGFRAIAVRGIGLLQIRDRLLDIGDILEEDFDQGVYIASVSAGIAGLGRAIIAVMPDKDEVQILATSKHGPFDKRVIDDALDKVVEAINGNAPKPRRRNGPLRVLLLFLLVALFAAAVVGALFVPIVIGPTQAATDNYNNAVEDFNAATEAYNAVASEVSVDNIRGMVVEAQPLSLQANDFFSVFAAVLGGNNADKIDRDAETVREMKASLDDGIRIMNEINNPDESWVVKHLESVDAITSVKAVTSDNDPNALLGKEGGYSSCVYFTVSLLNDNAVVGDNPVAKGTDGGGAIEVFPTLEDAKARCEYLSGFDDTILYSGSYALVGTMVVRTSCLLSDNNQYALTNDIVSEMTRD